MGEQGARAAVSPLGEQCWAPITYPRLAPTGGPESGCKKCGGLCTWRGCGSELPGPPNLQLSSPGGLPAAVLEAGVPTLPSGPETGDELRLLRLAGCGTVSSCGACPCLLQDPELSATPRLQAGKSHPRRSS